MNLLLANIHHLGYPDEDDGDNFECDLAEILERAGYVIGEILVQPKEGGQIDGNL